MNLKTLLFAFISSAFMMSCSNEDSSTLSENTPIVGLASYNRNVKTIIDNNCVVCHAAVPRNGAPNSLVTYDQVKEAILNRGLINRISLENGNGLQMPQGGPRMPQPTIDIIAKWQQDGLLEQ